MKKYSLFTEGEMEETLIGIIKTQILKCNTISKCKKDSVKPQGTIPLDKLKKHKCDCTNFVIMDKDDVDIYEYEKHCKKQNRTLIISYPSFEIVLLAIFKTVENKKLQKDIEKELSEYLKLEYEHNNKIIKTKIIKLLEDEKNI